SFGDYFKKEAIAWAWELLTEVYKIDKDRLYVTIFEGDEREGLQRDDEAYTEWKKWIEQDRILLGNKKDNFWEMGDTGPCGPCTEIHFDGRSDEERNATPGKILVNNDDPQVIEIWNIVFIQFSRLWDKNKIDVLIKYQKERLERKEIDEKQFEKLKYQFEHDKENTLLESLPAKHVDTGMGFERLVRVIQNKHSNYDTDVFTGTIKEIERITGSVYEYSDDQQDISFRVIADHIRAIAFTIADGQLPSNTGAGYVIRRILRRAVRYYYSYLDYKQPLLFQLIPLLAKQFQSVFPELEQQVDFVSKVVKEEEEAFLRTLEKGLRRFDEYFKETKEKALQETSKNNNGITTTNPMGFTQKLIADGRIAFELYDTYGFPFDLSKLIANDRGFKINEEEFQQELQKQKSRSRAATALDTEDWIVFNDNNKTEFIGYDSLETNANIIKYRKVKSKGKELYQIVLDKTPFYAESGGQVGDQGFLIPLSTRGEGQGVRIIDTKKENDLIIHIAENIPENISPEITAIVPVERRQNIALHHSATHLLHAALRQVLGTHVAQKGSLVTDDYLRFDFSHFSKVTGEETAQIEAIVNQKIRENIPVVIRYMNREDAVQTGAMALFGEKYGDIVRVVTIDPAYSIELCGGTHIGSTGNLGFFKIKSESAIAAGVRRMEAVVGKAAEDYVDEQLAELNKAKAALKHPNELSKSIENLVTDLGETKKKLGSAEAKLMNGLEAELIKEAININLTSFIGKTVDAGSADSLKKLSIELSKKTNGFVVLCANINSKATVAVSIAESLTSKELDANKIIKENVAPFINGGGGGSKTSAIAGGQDGSRFEQVINQMKALL
ncbi:MAG: alanine--tRNA ligase, partial [Bacteroidota bacterium]|nr:alanine--tRNA ligase [Bacteroidota bacterium]